MTNNHNNTENQKHKFSSDRPITSSNEDLLGRLPFCESLARAIKGWNSNESLVIALYGPWGSGKSSIKNIVLQLLRSGDPDIPLIVEFNPWQWSGQNQLAEAFFQEIGLVLGRSEDGKRRAVKWHTYGTYLMLGASVVKSLKTILPLLGLPLSAIVDTLAKGMEQSGNTMREGSKELVGQETACQQTLTEMKKEISDSLRSLGKPILVVLDDIDRLTPQEIRYLFQLVKANADFPNMVYLLLFQRDIVERSLDSSAITGREFLEKIVQIGFDIPRIERTRLEKILFAGLNEIFVNDQVNKHFDNNRWGNFFIGGLRPYFQTLRDVYRYLSTLSFYVASFRNLNSFEVNPIDLIALEALRVFEPGVYHRIPEAKAELTERRSRELHGSDAKDETKHTVESIVEQAAEAHRQYVREILKQLFPHAAWVFGGSGHYLGSEEQWFRELRVCHPDVFGRYFHLTIPEGDLSQADLDRILSLVGNRENLVSEFCTLNKRGLLGICLDRLEAYKEAIDLKHAVPFITALFDIGDDLPDEPTNPFQFAIGADMHAIRIICWYLKREKDLSNRGQILKEAMDVTTGLYLPVGVILWDSNRQEQQNPDAFLLNEDNLKDLEGVCVQKIRQAAESGVLNKNLKGFTILDLWRKWSSSDEEPRAWVKKLIKSKEGLISLLTAFLQKSTSHGIGDYVSKEHWRMSLTNLENFVAIEDLEKEVEQLSLDSIGENKQRVVKAFHRALKRRREGKPDESWLDNEDE